jgi:hypothetical protein
MIIKTGQTVYELVRSFDRKTNEPVYPADFISKIFVNGIEDLNLTVNYTTSNSNDGLYCYNFGLQTNPFEYQPNGGINMSKFKTIELEFKTMIPSLDPSASFFVICDPVTRTVVGVNKPTWIIYDYNFNLTVMEERYNILTFMSGNAALDYAR